MTVSMLRNREVLTLSETRLLKTAVKSDVMNDLFTVYFSADRQLKYTIGIMYVISSFIACSLAPKVRHRDQL